MGRLHNAIGGRGSDWRAGIWAGNVTTVIVVVSHTVLLIVLLIANPQARGAPQGAKNWSRRR